MSDEVQQQHRGTVGYTRKLNLGNYNSAEASQFIQYDVFPENDDVTLDNARAAAELARLLVLTELGIPFEVINGVPVEVPATVAAPIPTTVASVAAAFPGAVAVPAVANGDVACPKCGGGMYDNRATKKSPKQPDYRCRSYNKNPACDGVVWPPR